MTIHKYNILLTQDMYRQLRIMAGQDNSDMATFLRNMIAEEAKKRDVK